jgi:hypothetical protein
MLFRVALKEKLGYIERRIKRGEDPEQIHYLIQSTASLAKRFERDGYRPECFLEELRTAAEPFYRDHPEYAIKERKDTSFRRKAEVA